MDLRGYQDFLRTLDAEEKQILRSAALLAWQHAQLTDRELELLTGRPIDQARFALNKALEMIATLKETYL